MKKLVISLTLCVALVFGCTLTGCMLPAGSQPEPSPPVEYQENKNEYALKPSTIPDTNNNNNSQNNNQNNNQGVSGSFTTEQQTMRKSARYLFEQISLPQFVFGYEDDFIRCFQTSDLATAQKVIHSEWKLSAATILISALPQADQDYALQGEDQLYEVLNPLIAEYELGAEHLVSVTFEDIDSNRSCILIEMQEMDEELLCTYIAIVYDTNSGLKYYTVERTMSFGSSKNQYMFCYIEQSGRGSIGLVDSNKESVLKAIRDL